MRFQRRVPQVLVKWKGYGPEFNLWIDLSELKKVEEVRDKLVKPPRGSSTVKKAVKRLNKPTNKQAKKKTEGAGSTSAKAAASTSVSSRMRPTATRRMSLSSFSKGFQVDLPEQAAQGNFSANNEDGMMAQSFDDQNSRENQVVEPSQDLLPPTPKAPVVVKSSPLKELNQVTPEKKKVVPTVAADFKIQLPEAAQDFQFKVPLPPAAANFNFKLPQAVKIPQFKSPNMIPIHARKNFPPPMAKCLPFNSPKKSMLTTSKLII